MIAAVGLMASNSKVAGPAAVIAEQIFHIP